MRVLRRPRFVDDLSEAYAYLAEREFSAADRLIDEVEATARLLSAFPEIGRQRSELRENVRSFKLRGFPHILFYRLAEDAVILLRVLHGARDVDEALRASGGD